MKTRKHTRRMIVHDYGKRPKGLSPAGVSWSDVRSWHIARGFSTWGYHRGIGPDGTAYLGRAISLVGAHAYGRNRDSIGVCLMGDFSRGEPTPEALTALGDFYHAQCRFYGRRLKIEFHTNILTPWLWGKKTPCPGRVLDRADLLEVVYRRAPQ